MLLYNILYLIFIARLTLSQNIEQELNDVTSDIEYFTEEFLFPDNEFQETPIPDQLSIESEQIGAVMDQVSMLASSVPGGGIPGEDYPILHQIPETAFSCQDYQPGYYADTNPEAQCQVFHICQTQSRANSFLCPNGTIFNQKYFICDWWYNFDCSSAESFYFLNDKFNSDDYDDTFFNKDSFNQDNANDDTFDYDATLPVVPIQSASFISPKEIQEDHLNVDNNLIDTSGYTDLENKSNPANDPIIINDINNLFDNVRFVDTTPSSSSEKNVNVIEFKNFDLEENPDITISADFNRDLTDDLTNSNSIQVKLSNGVFEHSNEVEHEFSDDFKNAAHIPENTSQLQTNLPNNHFTAENTLDSHQSEENSFNSLEADEKEQFSSPQNFGIPLPNLEQPQLISEGNEPFGTNLKELVNHVILFPGELDGNASDLGIPLIQNSSSQQNFGDSLENLIRNVEIVNKNDFGVPLPKIDNNITMILISPYDSIDSLNSFLLDESLQGQIQMNSADSNGKDNIQDIIQSPLILNVKNMQFLTDEKNTNTNNFEETLNSFNRETTDNSDIVEYKESKNSAIEQNLSGIQVNLAPENEHSIQLGNDFIGTVESFTNSNEMKKSTEQEIINQPISDPDELSTYFENEENTGDLKISFNDPINIPGPIENINQNFNTDDISQAIFAVNGNYGEKLDSPTEYTDAFLPTSFDQNAQIDITTFTPFDTNSDLIVQLNSNEKLTQDVFPEQSTQKIDEGLNVINGQTPDNSLPLVLNQLYELPS